MNLSGSYGPDVGQLYIHDLMNSKYLIINYLTVIFIS